MIQTLPDPNTLTFTYSGELYIQCWGCFRTLQENEDCPECGRDTGKEWKRRPTEEENRRDHEDSERRKVEYRERERVKEEERTAALRAEKLEKARRKVGYAEDRLKAARAEHDAADRAYYLAKKALQRLEAE